MDFYYHYAILVINLFGFQDAVENPGADLAHFFSRCYSSAMGCVLVVCSELVPGGYMRYSPDSHFVFTTYAVLTLLKLAQPRFSHLRHDEQTSFEDAENVASVFESVAANPYHTPALYGAFLRKLVATMKEPPAFSSSFPTDGSHHEFNMSETQPPHEAVPGDSSEGLMGDGVLPNIESPPSPPPVDDTLPITDLRDAQPVSQNDESFYPHSQDQMALDDIQDLYTADGVFSSGHELWATMLMPGYGGQLDGLIGGSIDEMMGNEAQHMFGAFDLE
ncbi:hypothetical protein BDV93DRAFT_609590 [Ceratobasidium sp. AG-I]|nr:hypothetical protein BDV93DRAFT_609590 [Ceratobasidium sp. AG-I]